MDTYTHVRKYALRVSRSRDLKRSYVRTHANALRYGDQIQDPSTLKSCIVTCNGLKGISTPMTKDPDGGFRLDYSW